MAQLKDTKINGSASIEDALVVKGTSLFQNNVTIEGDLFVSGNLTTVNTEDLVVKDKLIEIASGSTTPEAANGAGVLIQGANASLTYNAGEDAMTFNKKVAVPEGLTHKIVISSSIDGVTFNSAEYNGSADAAVTINLHDYSASVATKIDAIESASAGDVSGLVDQINNVYASHSALSSSYNTDSASFDTRINNAATTENLTALSTSITATTDNIFSSHSALSTQYTADSASFDARIASASSATGDDLTALSASVATTTANIAETHTTDSASFDTRINNIASTASADLTALSSSVATTTNNIFNSHSALSSSYSADSASFDTRITNVASTASADLAAASQSLSASIAAEADRAKTAESELSASIAGVSGNYLSKVDATAANKMQVDLQMNGNKVALADGVNIYYDSTAQVINFEFPE